jgi:hypothetical protein
MWASGCWHAWSGLGDHLGGNPSPTLLLSCGDRATTQWVSASAICSTSLTPVRASTQQSRLVRTLLGREPMLPGHSVWPNASRVDRDRTTNGGGPMRRFALLVGIIVTLGLGGAPSAFAADPDVNHFTIEESFTDDNFCGTGEAVETSVFVRGTEFLAPNQPVDYRNVSQVKVVYTNPQNGATVIRHAAGLVSDTIISGDPEGVNTHELTVSGLSGLLRTADGSVLLGAGYIVFHEVFDGDEFVSREILVNRGPHPNLESDLVLFCDVTTEALGLS